MGLTFCLVTPDCACATSTMLSWHGILDECGIIFTSNSICEYQKWKLKLTKLCWFIDSFQALRGVLANLAMDIGRRCFDRTPVYTALNSTMAFEERLIDGDTFVAGPVSRGVNTCVKWPSDQYFIPVLQSNGKFEVSPVFFSNHVGS